MTTTRTIRRPPPHALTRGPELRFGRLEVRDAGGFEGKIHGLASATESPYSMGPYVETIKRGAFAATLARNPDVQLLINHDGLPLSHDERQPHPGRDADGARVRCHR